MQTNRLPGAIISQALRDVFREFKQSKKWDKNWMRQQDYAEAKAFLTDEVGGWAKSRREICDMANICPDRLRAAVIKHLQLGTNLKKLLEGFDHDTRSKANRGIKNR